MVSQTNIPKATLLDKLLLIPNIGRILFSLFFRLITYPIRSGPKAPTAYKDALYGAIRTNLSICTPGQEQLLNKPTEVNYKAICREAGISPESDVLDGGKGQSFKLHWFGSKRGAEKVVYYLHGGGYVLSASPGHLRWLQELQRDLTKGMGKKVSIVMPGYTLAPHGEYPQQLREAVKGLDFILNTLGYRPQDIIVAGDSAGGNLVLGLLGHLLHPHPDPSISPVNLSTPLAGTILISPWTKFAAGEDKSVLNTGSDMVSPVCSDRWSKLFMGSARLDNYNQPILTAGTDWWKGLSRVSGDVLVWGGGGELLHDSIQAMTKILKEQVGSEGRVELVIQPGVAHEDFIMEKLIGFKEKAEGTRLVEGWVSARL
ncbi:alpha/beta-hydrolase [Teratosphaeria nubilosa]|uniref:Alpha/beta-hydrolase n=1 Tax=Teratosphaeria nubilosa TaxID=161662 RepID=A0A6G1LMT3_9PEZI|nr:alpha/beta-hydrolase [Teratosphaeria nubilosa]